jgi:hypothetical protein
LCRHVEEQGGKLIIISTQMGSIAAGLCKLNPVDP